MAVVVAKDGDVLHQGLRGLIVEKGVGEPKPLRRWKGRPTKAHLAELKKKAKEDGREGRSWKGGYTGHKPDSPAQLEHQEKVAAGEWPVGEKGQFLELPETAALRKQAIHLRAVKRLTYAEIAEKLGVTKRRAIALIEKELGEAVKLKGNDAERVRVLELRALDDDERKLEEIASDAKADKDLRIRAIAGKARLRERRARLLGLDKQTAMSPIADAMKEIHARRPQFKQQKAPALTSEEEVIDASFDVLDKAESAAALEKIGV